MKKIPLLQAIETLCTSPNTAAHQPIYETYDKNVQGNTIGERGQNPLGVTACFSDFPELDRSHAQISVTIGTGGNPELAKIDAQNAAENAVLEADFKVACVGGFSLAATDCLNFGNPEKPKQMGDLVAGIKGVKTACEKLQIPIVSGNVSLYNESSGRSVPPSAIISIFGRVDDPGRIKPIGFTEKESFVFILGNRSENLGGSEFFRLHNQQDTSSPKINYLQHENLRSRITQAMEANLFLSINPILRGGMMMSVLQSAFSGQMGVEIEIGKDFLVPYFLFSEDLGAVITTDQPENVKKHFGDQAIAIGKTTQKFSLKITQGSESILDEKLEKLMNLWSNQLRTVF
jgi:phosphoribosylformylglycinamidine synthase subunit PurL